MSEFKKRMSLLGYGYQLVRQLTPTYLPCMLLRSFIIAAQPLVVLFFSARIINELAGGQDIERILIFAGSTVALSFIMAALRAFLDLEISHNAGWEQMYQRMQMMQAERFMRMDYMHAEDSKVSETLAKMDVQARGNGLGLMDMYFLTPTLVQNLFSMIISFLLLTTLSAGGVITPEQRIVLYVVFVVGMIVSMRYRMKQNVILENIFEENAKANTAAQFYNNYIKSGQAAKDVRMYNQTDALNKIFDASFDMNAWLRFFFFDARISGFSMALMSAIGGGLFLLVGYNALGGAGTIGGVVQTAGAMLAIATAVGTLPVVGVQLYNNGAFLEPMREFMTLPDLLEKGTKPVPKNASNFEFRNVSFKYPGAEGYALRSLNLRFNPGERMAVVGPNGSGKTTMIKLLCRLYDPTEGEILLDGVNIKEYDYEQYTALFSVVFQDFMLFPLWIDENVAVGQPDERLVREKIQAVGFTDRLDEMPNGLRTVLYKNFDEDGVQVSGGEAQKLALARALYKDAPMVVLDEPTAALDPIAEYEVYTTFEQTIGDKTAVFISHRLSSCRFCHDIAVFEKGRLVQRGGHEELLEDDGGLYAELWGAQAQHYVEG